VVIAGGGLAGVEAAWHLAQSGIRVKLKEMRPRKLTPAHKTGLLAELVCSNSLRAEALTSAVGLLKAEMARLGSLVMAAAQKTRVPAGKALAVDREAFAQLITERLLARPEVDLEEMEVNSISDLTQPDRIGVLATGPLTTDRLAGQLADLTGTENLHFYDAIAPLIEADSVDLSQAFWASRYADPDQEADYLNCPLTQEEYQRFHEALLAGDKTPLHSFEKPKYFEGCLPLEVMAERGFKTLAFGPLKPVGLVDPRTGKRPFAVVQLRREDQAGRYLNLVGCQTKLTQSAQKKAFRLIPALKEAVFVRLGSVHRNTFVCGPRVLAGDLSLQARPDLFLAGQICGVEGYVESAATGLLAGRFIGHRLRGRPFSPPPPETALGALLNYATKAPAKRFQPSNIHFGLFPPLTGRVAKKDRPQAYLDRARQALVGWLEDIDDA